MRRCLIVANQTLTSPQLLAQVRSRLASDECELHVLVPATPPHGGALWTEGEGVALARVALENALRAFHDEGIDATGEVGDENPVLAVGDVLNRRDVDEIILSTLAPGVSKWLKRDLPHRLARRFGLPVTHVVALPERVG
jgi:hypothetical protein